jgi:hypothetical protein
MADASRTASLARVRAKTEVPLALPRISMIQVGDLHLPSAMRSPLFVDKKDSRFPLDLLGKLASPPIKTVFRAIHQLLEKGEYKAITFMGDVTDYGDLAGFQAGCLYIADSLEIHRGGRHGGTAVGIVPGNHDVDRKLALAPGMVTKFKPLQDAVGAAKLPPLPIEAPVWLHCSEPPCSIRIALLNSCWGCGAKEFIPKEFSDRVAEAIKKAIDDDTSNEAMKAYYDRQLDTPAFSEDDLYGLIEGASKHDGTDLLVICAHHNLLPQRLTRLAPYTELVNSGAFRGTLIDLERPIIYLHGHIHEDPIEVLQRPGSYPLVCISAPEASKGFNVLEALFTKDGIPLSVRIVPWRFDKSGFLRAQPSQSVALIGPRRRSSDSLVAEVYAELLRQRACYWSAILNFPCLLETTDKEEVLEEALELLQADGRITIENHDLPFRHWIVEARI